MVSEPHSVTLFGIRSPLVVEYEESLHRCGIAIAAAVSVEGAPRVMDPAPVVELARFAPQGAAPFLACAFTPARRRALAEQAGALGLVPAPALVDPHAVLARSVRAGEASFVNAGAIIGALSLLGQGVLVNRAASIGHHAMIGDFTSIGPGAVLAGNIHVGAGCMIGAGAVILPDLRIGAGCIIAAGSLVREDVPDGAFVAGSPARARVFDPARSALNIEGAE
ncbi:MAG: acetyltransferase [Rubellimicrobium sp.]|nr:acetyltransferase [Rubellimicrobium sp.]